MPSKLKSHSKPSGPVRIGKLIVEVDRNLCIGAATCVALASKTFALDKEAKSVVLETADQENEEMVIEAARSCPVAAIVVKRENGEPIFPR